MNDESITSLKLTSQTTNQYSHFTSFDKLIHNTSNLGFTVKVVKSNIAKRNSCGNETFIEDDHFQNKKTRIQISFSDSDAKIYLLKSSGTEEIHSVITNPSHFSSFEDYITTLKELLGEISLDSAKIRRFDIAVDFKLPYEQLIQSFDVSFKRITNATAYNGSNINWVTFGNSKSGEFIKAYDKTKTYKLGHPVSRIEVQYTTPKIRRSSILYIKDLILFVQTKGFEKLLKNIRLKDYRYKINLDDKSLYKKRFLEGALSIAPLSIVRRRLNPNGNFKRDYGKVLDIKCETLPFWYLAHIGINEWIEKGSDYDS